MKNIKLNNQNYNDVQKIKTQLQGSSSYAEFVDTSDANATSSDVLKGKTCYVNGEKVVGTKVESGEGTTINLQEKTVTDNGTYTADDGYDGLSKVTVNVEKGTTPTGTKDITANGTHDVTNYASVNVNVSTGGSSGEVANFPFPHNNIQTGSFTPTENEETHSITLPFTPKGFMCIMEDMENVPGLYAGCVWTYHAINTGGAFAVYRYNSANTKPILTGTTTSQAIDGNTIILSGNVVQPNYYFYAGRTYNWVAWDY